MKNLLEKLAKIPKKTWIIIGAAFCVLVLISAIIVIIALNSSSQGEVENTNSKITKVIKRKASSVSESGSAESESSEAIADNASKSTAKPFVPDLNFVAKKGVSVMQVGAVGDGKTDDTEAFNKAIYYAQMNKMQVYVPPGTYRITDTLYLSSVTMLGYSVTCWPADKINLPTILIDNVSSPGISLNSSAISGIRIKCKNRTDKFPAITCASTGTITNVGITDAGWAIELPNFSETGFGNPGRSDLENISIENVSSLGVFCSGTLDVTYFKNIRIISTNENFKASGIGFTFYRNDGVRVTDCYVNGASVAYQLNDTEKLRSTLANYENCSAENVKTGILVNSVATNRIAYAISFYGGKIVASENAVKINKGRMQLMLYNMVLDSVNDSTISILGGENIQLNNCNITCTSLNVPAVLINGSVNTIVNRCKVNSAQDGIKLTNANECAVITSNVISAVRQKFDDTMPSNSQKVISGNT